MGQIPTGLLQCPQTGASHAVLLPSSRLPLPRQVSNIPAAVLPSAQVLPREADYWIHCHHDSKGVYIRRVCLDLLGRQFLQKAS